MRELDRTDYRILQALKEDGRLSVTTLARTVNLSVSPCWRRVKLLEQTGIIRRYTAEIALEKLQTVQIVLAHVVLATHTRAAYEAFERSVREIPEAVECYELTGHVDYHLKFVVASMERYTEILEVLLGSAVGVEKYYTYVVTRAAMNETDSLLRDLVRRR